MSSLFYPAASSFDIVRDQSGHCRCLSSGISGRIHKRTESAHTIGEVMYVDNFVNADEMPMGLGMALAQNLDAMNYFSALPPEARRQIIGRTHSIQSKEEMQSFVASLISAQ